MRQEAKIIAVDSDEQPNRKNLLLDCHEMFNQLYVAVVELLEDISQSLISDWNCDTITDPSSLLVAIINFQFLMSFVLLFKGLSPLSISLLIDNCKAYNQVFKTKEAMKSILDFDWFDIAKDKSILLVVKG